MSAIDAFCPVGIGGTKGIDVSSLKIFVGGLSPDQSSKDLYDVFSPFGTIRESVVIPDRFRVTFKDEESVNRVFDELPIIAPNGQKLRVVLAASNTKPRRAHCSAKHGTSGHKAPPTVREEEESMMEPSHFKQSNHGDQTKKVSVYSDPSPHRNRNESKMIRKRTMPKLESVNETKNTFGLSMPNDSPRKRPKHKRQNQAIFTNKSPYKTRPRNMSRDLRTEMSGHHCLYAPPSVPVPPVRKENERKAKGGGGHKRKPVPSDHRKDGKKIAVNTDVSLYRRANKQRSNAAAFKVKSEDISLPITHRPTPRIIRRNATNKGPSKDAKDGKKIAVYTDPSCKKAENARRVLENGPITTEDRNDSTVILAAANIKPRRANFNVKHGVSGSKPLPMVREEDERKAKEEEEGGNNDLKRKKQKYNKPVPSKDAKDGKKIAVYTDPSLYRTANIQTINAAEFNVKSEKDSKSLEKENAVNSEEKRSVRRLEREVQDIHHDPNHLKVSESPRSLRGRCVKKSRLSPISRMIPSPSPNVVGNDNDAMKEFAELKNESPSYSSFKRGGINNIEFNAVPKMTPSPKQGKSLQLHVPPFTETASRESSVGSLGLSQMDLDSNLSIIEMEEQRTDLEQQNYDDSNINYGLHRNTPISSIQQSTIVATNGSVSKRMAHGNGSGINTMQSIESGPYSAYHQSLSGGPTGYGPQGNGGNGQQAAFGDFFSFESICCKTRWNKRKLFNGHIASHQYQNGLGLQCPYCSHTAKRNDQLVDHMHSKHTEKFGGLLPYKCMVWDGKKICGHLCASEKSGVAHLLGVHEIEVPTQPQSKISSTWSNTGTTGSRSSWMAYGNESANSTMPSLEFGSLSAYNQSFTGGQTEYGPQGNGQYDACDAGYGSTMK